MGVIEIVCIVLGATVIVEGFVIWWLHRRTELLEAFCYSVDQVLDLDFIFEPDEDIKKKWEENLQKEEAEESKPDKT